MYRLGRVHGGAGGAGGRYPRRVNLSLHDVLKTLRMIEEENQLIASGKSSCCKLLVL